MCPLSFRSRFIWEFTWMTPPPPPLIPYNFLIHVDAYAHPGLKWSQENLGCHLFAEGGGGATQPLFGRHWLSAYATQQTRQCWVSIADGGPTLILNTLNYFCVNRGDQRIFSIWNHLSWLFPLHLNTYIVASELKDPICHSDECQIGSFSSEATTCYYIWM